LQERKIIYIATPVQFPGPKSIWLLRYFIRLSQSGPSLFGCWCMVTPPSFQPMNQGLCYFAREEDYIYCNSCSIPKTQIHLVVEGSYCPVTKSGSFAAVPLLPGDPPKFPANEPRTLLFCKRGLLYMFQLHFNFQDQNPSGCGELLLVLLLHLGLAHQSCGSFIMDPLHCSWSRSELTVGSGTFQLVYLSILIVASRPKKCSFSSFEFHSN